MSKIKSVSVRPDKTVVVLDINDKPLAHYGGQLASVKTKILRDSFDGVEFKNEDGETISREDFVGLA